MWLRIINSKDVINKVYFGSGQWTKKGMYLYKHIFTIKQS